MFKFSRDKHLPDDPSPKVKVKRSPVRVYDLASHEFAPLFVSRMEADGYGPEELNGGKAFVADFGRLTVCIVKTATRAVTYVGTPTEMAPVQAVTREDFEANGSGEYDWDTTFNDAIVATLDGGFTLESK